MLGMCRGALSERNGRPTPWNRPSRSNSLLMPMVSSTSSVGKSSTLITRPAHRSRKVSGNFPKASVAMTSKAMSDGALSGRQASGSLSGLELIVSLQIGEVQIDGKRDDGDEAQAASDAEAPQLDPVGGAVRSIADRVPGCEVI